MKGQAFIIIAIIISSSLLIIRASSLRPMAVEERRQLEVTFENSMYEDIAAEFENVLRYSYYNSSAIPANMLDFGNFSETKLGEHAMDFQMIYIGCVANRTTSYMNISVVNLMGSSVDVNLTLNDTQSNATTLANYRMWTANFSMTPGKHYILTARYGSDVENVSVNTKSNKDSIVSYFDLRLTSEQAVHRTKFSKKLDFH